MGVLAEYIEQFFSKFLEEIQLLSITSSIFHSPNLVSLITLLGNFIGAL